MRSSGAGPGAHHPGRGRHPRGGAHRPPRAAAGERSGGEPVPGRMAGTGRPGAAPAARRAHRRTDRRGVPAVAAAHQRGEQAQPARWQVLATQQPPLPRRQRGQYGANPASPRVTGLPEGRRVVLPCHWIGDVQARAAPLAVGAQQPAEVIVLPPGGESTGADVGLAERRWVDIPRDAGRHLTPGGGPSDPVTHNRPLGDGNRPRQRVSWHRPPRGPRPGNALAPPAVPPAFARRRGHPALPPGRPGVPGDGSRRHAGLPE